MRAPLAFLLPLLTVSLVSWGAHAEGAGGRASAEELFESARRDLRAGKTADACPKLEESQRLDPGVGTLLHLGECYERLGRTASAWTSFREASALAKRSGDAEREKLANDRAERLSPTLARLVVVVPTEADVEGLAISLDGAPHARVTWPVAVPVDPGPHRLEATAPQHHAVRWSIEAVAGQTVRAALAPLPQAGPPPGVGAGTPLPVASSAPSQAPASPPPTSSHRTWVVVGTAVTAATLVTGATFGLVAQRAWSRSRDECDDDNACSAAGLADIDRAKSSATVATALVGAGALLGSATLVLHWTLPRAGDRQIAAGVGPGGVRLAVRFP